MINILNLNRLFLFFSLSNFILISIGLNFTSQKGCNSNKKFQMNHSAFISTSFTQNQLNRNVTIHWDNVLKMDIILHLNENGMGDTVKYQQPISMEMANDLQGRLRMLQSEKVGATSENELILKYINGDKIGVSWATAEETPQLQTIRQQFEQYGHLNYKQAKMYVNISEKLEENDIGKSIYFLKKGVEILGDSYESDKVLDSTGMKRALALSEEKKGNMQKAYHLLQNVLLSRLSIYDEKFDRQKIQEK